MNTYKCLDCSFTFEKQAKKGELVDCKRCWSEVVKKIEKPIIEKIYLDSYWVNRFKTEGKGESGAIVVEIDFKINKRATRRNASFTILVSEKGIYAREGYWISEYSLSYDKRSEVREYFFHQFRKEYDKQIKKLLMEEFPELRFQLIHFKLDGGEK